jgi:hypothetical protein
MEANVTKCAYIRNEQAHAQNNSARFYEIGDKIPEQALETPFKILGVFFATNLDWTYHKQITKGRIFGQLKTLARRRITDVQLVEVVNVMLMTALTYGMQNVPYSMKELDALEAIIHRQLRIRLKICTDPKGWKDWLP